MVADDPEDKPPSGGVTAARQAVERPFGPEDTVELLALAKAGDSAAMNRLFQRCIPALQRWARGRLPGYAREMVDTADLVQDAVTKALRRIEAFESRHEGALQAYLRQAVANAIRDEIRRAVRRPAPAPLSENHVDGAASPLEEAIGRQNVERYEAALQRLRPQDREAIIARLELQYSYEELALALGKPNANAARVAVTRAMYRLVEELSQDA